MQTDPVSEMLCFLEYRIMGKVQKPIDSECYSPSSEPFRIKQYTFYNSGVRYMDVVEALLPYRNATKTFLPIFDLVKISRTSKY
jgi:hypothetical protein